MKEFRRRDNPDHKVNTFITIYFDPGYVSKDDFLALFHTFLLKSERDS